MIVVDDRDREYTHGDDEDDETEDEGVVIFEDKTFWAIAVT